MSLYYRTLVIHTCWHTINGCTSSVSLIYFIYCLIIAMFHHFGILKYRCMSSFIIRSIFHVYDLHLISCSLSLSLLVIYSIIIISKRNCLLLALSFLTNGMYAVVLCSHMCDIYVLCSNEFFMPEKYSWLCVRTMQNKNFCITCAHHL